MNKKRIFISALTGTIALAALSVSLTLAWYGVSDRLGIGGLNVSVFSVTNLKISTSTDPNTFKDELNKEDLKDEDEKEIIFAPVTSMFQDSWYDIEDKKDTPLFYDNSLSMVTSDGEPKTQPITKGKGFFQKELYLMTNLEDYFVGLDIDKCVFKADEDENLNRASSILANLQKKDPQIDLSVSQIAEMLNNLSKCLRISILVTDPNFYSYYILDPTKEVETYYGGVLDNDRDGFYDTYETQENGRTVEKEVVYGEVKPRSSIAYDDPIVSNPDESTQQNPKQEDIFFDNSFEGISKDTAYTFNKNRSEENGLVIEKENSISLDDLREDDHRIKIPCYQNTPSKIVLSIYMEGWDLDCINATMGADFDVELSFKLIGGIV